MSPNTPKRRTVDSSMRSFSASSLWLILAVGTAFAPPAHAHRMNKSKAIWDAWVQKNTLEMTLRLAPTDLQQLMTTAWSQAPQEGEGKPTDPDAPVFDVVRRGFTVLNNGQPCAFQPLNVRKEHDMIIRARWLCEAPLDRLEVSTDLLRRLPDRHQHQVRFRVEGRERPIQTLTRINHQFRHRFVPQEPDRAPTIATQPVAKAAPSPARTAGERAGRRIDCVCFGWDHLLLLLGLLVIIHSLRGRRKRKPPDNSVR
jgi:hypothetical protein